MLTLETMAEIEVKALIDKKKNKIIFVECYGDLVDVLFGFLIMPMGLVTKLIENQPSPATIGSMNNLFKSVEGLDAKHFRTSQCKDKLLCPGNLHEPPAEHESELFVKGLTTYLISDGLQIIPVSTAACFSLLSEQGLKNDNDIEERSFVIGKFEILSILKNLFVTKTPLTETLLKNGTLLEPSQENLNQAKITTQDRIISESKGVGNICVKLILSKTKKAVCYAEVEEDFVDFLFSFLTTPLGTIAKEMNSGPYMRCANNLHESVQNIATKFLVSDETKQLLLCHKISPHWGFEKDLPGIKEVANKQYDYGTDKTSGFTLASDTFLPTPEDIVNYVGKLTSPYRKPCYNSKETKRCNEYMKGPAMFTVTDSLVIKPISSISSLSILKELNVPFSDIEERIVNVGKKEAAHLLVASLISKSPLTDVFIGHVTGDTVIISAGQSQPDPQPVPPAPARPSRHFLGGKKGRKVKRTQNLIGDVNNSTT